MKNIKTKLMKKGWRKSDINKTVKIIEKAKKSKHPKIKMLDKQVFSFSLILAIMGNFIISISLIPVLLVLNSILLYVIIVIMALTFGLLFELLIRSIEHLETKHHILLGVIIPIVAVINFVNMVIFSNKIEKILNIQNPQNPYLVAVIYAVSFILPYAVYQVFLKDK